jgi:hypothetical protein
LFFAFPAITATARMIRRTIINTVAPALSIQDVGSGIGGIRSLQVGMELVQDVMPIWRFGQHNHGWTQGTAVLRTSVDFPSADQIVVGCQRPGSYLGVYQLDPIRENHGRRRVDF